MSERRAVHADVGVNLVFALGDHEDRPYSHTLSDLERRLQEWR